jgi:hypothetical protein
MIPVILLDSITTDNVELHPVLSEGNNMHDVANRERNRRKDQEGKRRSRDGTDF